MDTTLAAITLFLVVGIGGTVVFLMVFLIKLVKDLDTTLSLDPNLTLQEVLRSLQLAAKLAAKVATDLEVNLAESRQQFSRLVILLDRMQMDVTATGESGVRAEHDRAVVAEDLAALQKQARDSEVGAPGLISDIAAGGMVPKSEKPAEKPAKKPAKKPRKSTPTKSTP